MSRADSPPPTPHKSAEELYQEARERWAKVVDLGLYDDQKAIYTVTPILEKALRQDPKHIKSLALLSDLVMEMGAYADATEMVANLLVLEPAGKVHQDKWSLLERKNSKEKRDAIRDHLETRWQTTDDW
jgi:hypothetical protein